MAKPEKLESTVAYPALTAAAQTFTAAIPANTGRIARPANRAAKRALDLVLAITALILLAPLLIGLAILLKREGGDVFFTQKRVGLGRARFNCLKFRTMLPDAEARLARMLETDPEAAAEWRTHQKLTNDPRITRLGRILRATSLDELPQLWNVIRGEMSLVGPRPIVAPEVAGYDADHAYYASETMDDYAACMPGITGLWQVSGRHTTVHDERIRLDRAYARTWSFTTDLTILFRTVRVVLDRSGG